MVDPDSHVSQNKQNIEGLQIRARLPQDAGAIADLHNLPGYRFGTLRTPLSYCRGNSQSDRDADTKHGISGCHFRWEVGRRYRNDPLSE